MIGREDGRIERSVAPLGEKSEKMVQRLSMRHDPDVCEREMIINNDLLGCVCAYMF